MPGNHSSQECRFTVVQGPALGSSFAIPAGRLEIGRLAGTPIQLPDVTVSRRHALIDRSASTVTITDIGSANGTYVNGVRLQGPRELLDGDEVRLGAVVLRFSRGVTPTVTARIPPPPAEASSWPTHPSLGDVRGPVQTGGGQQYSAGRDQYVAGKHQYLDHSVNASDDYDPRDEREAPWWRRGWKRAAAIVLSVGAVAAAIGSMLSLWPDPDPADSARFTSVDVFPLVPLSEYKERALQVMPQGARMPPTRAAGSDIVALVAARADVLPQAPLDPLGTGVPESSPSLNPPATGIPESTPATEGVPTPTGPTTTDHTPSESVSPSQSDGVRDGPFDLSPEMTRRAIEEVLPLINDRTPEYVLPTPSPSVTQSPRPVVAFLKIVEAASVDPEGKPVSVEVAVERVVKLLGETRTAKAAGGKLEPLGAVVDVNVELEGLRGRPVLLTWSIWQQGGETRLFGKWLETTAAYRLEATSNHDTAGFNIWVPMPKEPGPYVVRLALTADGVSIASTNSQPFT
jgi:FHA domain